ncbi:hypothetical protein ABMA80_15895 [Halobacteriovorax sp. FRX-3]|uniref:hypothetical protein n=1 Tax=Halobacteriovorax sp. FRX-3 TaxID=3157712 RepID=UPI003711B52D
MKFKHAHAACKGGKVHRERNVTWKTDGNGNAKETIVHDTVAAAKHYMLMNARTKGEKK